MDKYAVWGKAEIGEEELIKVLKGVSLWDLSGCFFEYDKDGSEQWVNAVMGGSVVDSVSWDGNIFKMMNNDDSFSPLNPMIKGYQLAGILQPDESATQLPVDRGVEKAAEEIFPYADEPADKHDIAFVANWNNQIDLKRDGFVAGAKWAVNDADKFEFAEWAYDSFCKSNENNWFKPGLAGGTVYYTTEQLYNLFKQKQL